MILRRLLPTVAVVGLAASASAATEPVAGLTKQRAEAAFGINVLFPCLTSVEQGKSVSDLEERYRSDLTPAQADDAKVPTGRERPTAVWISKTLGSHLHVVELGPNKCMVLADQLPVQDTLSKTAGAIQGLQPPYVAVPVKPGYWPVTFEMVGERNGRHIDVKLEGAEPGAPGHLYRFAALSATITARPAS